MVMKVLLWSILVVAGNTLKVTEDIEEEVDDSDGEGISLNEDESLLAPDITSGKQVGHVDNKKAEVACNPEGKSDEATYSEATSKEKQDVLKDAQPRPHNSQSMAIPAKGLDKKQKLTHNATHHKSMKESKELKAKEQNEAKEKENRKQAKESAEAKPVRPQGKKSASQSNLFRFFQKWNYYLKLLYIHRKFEYITRW